MDKDANVGMQWCIGTQNTIVSDVDNHRGRSMGIDIMDAYHVQLEVVYCELVALKVLGRITNPMGMDRVREALGILQSLVEDYEGDN